MPQGRQKIQIVGITNQNSSSVAFTKRRSGVFKKASELCTLCGAQIAIIILSQTRKKVYSFGDPSVEAIVNRFLTRDPDPPRSRTSRYVELVRNASIQELYNQLTNMVEKLECEKKTGEDLQKIRKDNQENYWWDAPIETLGLAELEQLKMTMFELQECAEKQAERLRAEVAFGSTFVCGVGLSINGCEGL